MWPLVIILDFFNTISTWTAELQISKQNYESRFTWIKMYHKEIVSLRWTANLTSYQKDLERLSIKNSFRDRIVQFLLNKNMEMLSHALYILELKPCQYCLVPKLKFHLTETIEKMQNISTSMHGFFKFNLPLHIHTSFSSLSLGFFCNFIQP